MREQKKLAVLKKLEETRPNSKIMPDDEKEIQMRKKNKNKYSDTNNFI